MLAVVLVFSAPLAKALDYHAEYSIAAASYQAHFDEWSGKGYRLMMITGYDDASGNVFYNAIWHKNIASVTWRAYHGIPEGDYQANFDTNTGDGYRPVFIDGFSVSGSPYINVIYHNEANPPEWVARHGQSGAGYQTHFDNVVPLGFDMDVVSSYQQSGVMRLASLFSRYTNNNAWVGRHGMTASEYQGAFDDLTAEGYYVEYLSVGTIQGGSPRFAAHFVKANGQPAWVAFHGVSNDQVQSKLDEWVNQGVSIDYGRLNLFFPVLLLDS